MNVVTGNPWWGSEGEYCPKCGQKRPVQTTATTGTSWTFTPLKEEEKKAASKRAARRKTDEVTLNKKTAIETLKLLKQQADSLKALVKLVRLQEKQVELLEKQIELLKRQRNSGR